MTEAKLIDGKAIAAASNEALAAEATAFAEEAGAPPCLAVVLVGDDPASAIYVRNKGRTAEKIGFRSIKRVLPADASHEAVASEVAALNDDPSVHGILVQLPLPAQVDASAIIELIDPEKDVDGFHPLNVGRLAAGELERALVPCTPAGVVALARDAMGDDLAGAEAVIVGRSNIVGKPAAHLLLAENCTVTIAHSRTRSLADVCRRADLLVAAVGRPALIQGDWIKPGATVIDVGINRAPPPADASPDARPRLIGDVDFEPARRVAAAITPVPGGVGPMTIAMLMRNTLTAAHRQFEARR